MLRGADLCLLVNHSKPLKVTQRTQKSLRCFKDVLKRPRRLTTKQYVGFKTSSRRLIYVVFNTSNLRSLDDIQFTTSDLRLLEDD